MRSVDFMLGVAVGIFIGAIIVVVTLTLCKRYLG